MGSGCLFFALTPKRSLLADFNIELIAFYQVLKASPCTLHREFSKFPVSREFYYEIRDWDAASLSRTRAAARFLYLNRFCFNGVYRTNKKGQFNVPFGSKTGQVPTLSHLISASALLADVELVPADFAETVAKAERGDFYYMDPPYAASRYRGEYGYGAFASSDLERLVAAADYIDNRGATFLISYKHDPAVARSLQRWFQSRVHVRRHVAGFAGARGSVAELLISNRSFREAQS